MVVQHAIHGCDFLYQPDSSRNYDPSRNLEKIRVPVMAINSADDFINPPELGIVPVEINRVRKGKFVLLPITDATRGPRYSYAAHNMVQVS
jgi:homoserine O-acetyltransferase/O-succinyltransferase